MCCCGTPTINGQPGYRWQPSDPPRVRPVDPPALAEGDTLLHDEPGRCGRKTDSHCYHFRIVRCQFGQLYILVRHGGGDERIQLGSQEKIAAALDGMGSDDRYWLIQTIYHAIKDQVWDAESRTNAMWRAAAAEKRIKTRKTPGRDHHKVWIEPREAHQAV
jgi:hypothetical protein